METALAKHEGVSVCDVLASLSHRDESHLLCIAFGIAVLLHFGMMLVAFPDMRRAVQAGPKGNVTLQAPIRADGTVVDLKVLRSNHANSGFEEAAVEAVRQWRYRPARLDGRPVEVFFTVFVEFRLH